MNNKGFIATSLIYSFFLIFITLFLTIIADYLQNKVLLNTIENGIKDNINNTKSIEDFDVGDIITINNINGVQFNENVTLPDQSMWIIAGMTYKSEDQSEESSLILYSLSALKEDSISEEDINDCKDEVINVCKIVTYNWIKKDLSLTGNDNSTRITELINTSKDNYLLYYEDGEEIIEIKPQCFDIVEDEPNFIDCKGPLELDSFSYRERIVISPFNSKVKVTQDATGGFIIEEVLQ